VIRTCAVAATLAGAILLAPVAQAQPGRGTGPEPSNPGANVASINAGPTSANKGNMVVPTIRATPFGATNRQPGLATALANGGMVVPTGMPFGFTRPIAKGNLVGPATATTPLSGDIRTRHGRTGGTEGTSLLEALRGALR
jgi:hypothetical protein